VQDLPPNAAGANEAIKAQGLENRVQFLAHDFFALQPESAKGAAAYLMRYIIHDWSDEYARKILSNIVAVMSPESRLIIADAVLPPPGVVAMAQEKTLRAFDVSMFVQLNARERAFEDWQDLLQTVDPRLKITAVKPPPPGISVSVLEVKLS
jgi:SAM-dependent methyltransferase